MIMSNQLPRDIIHGRDRLFFENRPARLFFLFFCDGKKSNLFSIFNGFVFFLIAYIEAFASNSISVLSALDILIIE
jgi:hypothetical protein